MLSKVTLTYSIDCTLFGWENRETVHVLILTSIFHVSHILISRPILTLSVWVSMMTDSGADPREPELRRELCLVRLWLWPRSLLLLWTRVMSWPRGILSRSRVSSLVRSSIRSLITFTSLLCSGWSKSRSSSWKI